MMRIFTHVSLRAILLFFVLMTALNGWGQGNEDFTNLPTTTPASYLSRTWTGTDGVTWTAEGARTDRTLNGKAITFGTSGSRWVTSPVYAGGMGTLKFNYVRDFTGTGTRTIQVYVNGTQVGTDITVSPTSDGVIQYSQAINIGGNIQLEIRSIGAAQVKIDDINWTSYSTSSVPTKLAITLISPSSPTANAPFNVTVQAQDNTNTAANVTAATDVTLSVQTGTGTLGGTITGTIPAGSNAVTISGVTYSVAESGVVLTATRTSGDNLTAGNSAAFTVVAPPVEGLQLTATNTRVTIDFDNTVASSNNGQFAGARTAENPAAGELNSTTWAINSGVTSGAASFTPVTTGGGLQAIGTHPSGGNFYAFETEPGNVALGFQATGSYFNPGSVTLKIQNNTGSTINSLSILYRLLSYNDQGRGSSFELSFSVDNSSYSPLPAFGLETPAALDQAPVWKSHVRAAEINGISVSADGFIFIRWTSADASGSGSRDELAIDDINIVANSTNTHQLFSGSIQDAIIGTNTSLPATTNITDSIKLLAGATLLTNNNLTLRSTMFGTARVATSAGTISGNVTVERFIPNKRAWRLLAAPLANNTNAPTIFTSWQEGGNPGSFGTHITKPGATGTDGYDVSSMAAASSIRFFDGSVLQTPATTNATKVTDNGGAYFLFVRGDRTIDLTNTAASSSTILRMTGNINQGNLSVGVQGANFSLIPNPYPSPVDYEKIFNGNSLSGVYYVWDATMGTGAYRTVDRQTANTYQVTPSTGSAASDNLVRLIRSGQAIFVPGTSTVSFTEAMKTDSVATANVFRTGSGTEELTIDLKVVTGTATTLVDGVRAKFSNSYSNAVDNNDITKINNFSENLAIVRESKNLSVEKRDLVESADTVFMRLWNTGIKNYQFELQASDFSTSANLEAYLLDKYLQTSTPVSLTGNTAYDFSITSDAASAAQDRFMVVFKTATTLPVAYASVKAYQKNSGVQVEWNVATEVNTNQYEVEKSVNGTTFSKAGNVVANGTGAYSWFDAQPSSGANYYRIKAIDNNGAGKLSQVVSVKIGGTKAGISIYPNPVEGNVLNLQLNNLAAGVYELRLYNNLGQQVMVRNIKHAGGSATQTINLTDAVGAGIYQLQLGNVDLKMNHQVIVK
ncbi:T9SS type A sorting domain-containing protein [Aridibaculum aurantiacum]|uniref:T9SS type A sorting domain-containing protein n=1 Tax=Aridibaculum aurantiacum TaxID=2810307 RepID=UPI001A9726B0|nr:T9SS type A sorting domain-containing protein [Aridibaculum aurantiacum]